MQSLDFYLVLKKNCSLAYFGSVTIHKHWKVSDKDKAGLGLGLGGLVLGLRVRARART